MTPEFAASARLNVEAGAGDAAREPPPVLGYVRTAVGEDARRAAGQGGVVLPRPPRRLPQPLRPPRRARGHGRGRRRRPRRGAAAARRLRGARRDRRPRPRQRHGRGDDRGRRGRRPVSACPGCARAPGSRWRRSRCAAGAGAAPQPPLAHEGRWFTDAKGRVVILHGLNMVYKVGSYRPADAGFGADDARFLRRHGFNTIRLGIIYKGLEPKPPVGVGQPAYRRGYVRSIAAHRVGARRAGDLHPARLPPGPLQRALPGRGLARLAGARRRRPGRAAGGLPRQLPRQRRASTAPSTTSGPTPRSRAAASRTPTPPPGAGWRRSSASARTWSATTCSTSRGRARPSTPTTASTPPAARPSTQTTLAPFNERVIERDPRRRPRDADLLRAAGHLRLRRRLAAPRHRRPGGRVLLPRLLPPGSARRPGLRARLRAARGHGLRERRQAVGGDRRRPVPDRVRRHRRPRDDRAHRPPRRRPHDLVAVLALLRLRRPDHLGPGVQALVIDAAKPPHGANVNREKLGCSPGPTRGRSPARRAASASTRRRRRFELVYSTRAPEAGELGRRLAAAC